MLISVDTNVLLDLALKTDAVVDAISTVRKRLKKVRLIVPPTVLQELAFLHQCGETEKHRQTALEALLGLEGWGIEPLNLVPVGHGIAERISDELCHKGILPIEERNDALILTESALMECNMFVSADSHLRGIDFQRLQLLLQDFDLSAPVIATPREIVHKFFRA